MLPPLGEDHKKAAREKPPAPSALHLVDTPKAARRVRLNVGFEEVGRVQVTS